MFNQLNLRPRQVAAAGLCAASLLGLALSGCGKSKDESTTAAPPAMVVQDGAQIRIPENSPMRPRIVVAPVGQTTEAHVLAVPAVVEADPAAIANLLPPLTGRVERLLVNIGDQVQVNQTLAILDSPDLTQAVADVKKARDAEHLADEALKRAQGVNDAGANAIKDLEQAQSGAAQASAERERAEARLNVLMPQGPGANDRQLVIKAPMAGVITALNVGVGSMINDVTQPLLTLANIDSVWITARVPEAEAASAAKGLAADITLPAFPGQTLHGTVTSVAAVLDADTRRMQLHIRMANHDQRLKPNMYAVAALHIPQNAAVVVPPSALLMNNDAITVLVEVQPWVFERRVVQTGDEDGNAVRILSGLKSGERVVVRGGVLLND
jgi:cobalt-zinc-cadmium efflux system membrane fusion protein